MCEQDETKKIATIVFYVLFQFYFTCCWYRKCFDTIDWVPLRESCWEKHSSSNIIVIIIIVIVCFLLFLGCSNKETGRILKELFQASYFRITVVPDGQTVELCGALKVGFCLHHSQSFPRWILLLLSWLPILCNFWFVSSFIFRFYFLFLQCSDTLGWVTEKVLGL